MNSISDRISAPDASVASSSRWPAALVLVMGFLVVYGAGFAHPMAIHNATHDTRHAFGLPCH